MKRITLIIFLITTGFVYGQSDFKSLIENVHNLAVPYTSQYNNEIQNQRKILTDKDSTFLITKLSSRQPKKVNNIVSSPFGQMDCEDVKDCLNLESLEEIAIIGLIKVDSNNYLFHITLKPKGQFAITKGILVSINKVGDLNDWFFADIGAGGNPNGNVSREFKIDIEHNVIILESSWGRNNLNYSLELIFKIFRQTANQDDEYDRIQENKMEDFDLSEGKFELIKLCLDI
jgi:hypothetical protein